MPLSYDRLTRRSIFRSRLGFCSLIILLEYSFTLGYSAKKGNDVADPYKTLDKVGFMYVRLKKPGKMWPSESLIQELCLGETHSALLTEAFYRVK
jgi:hypothetical protein